MNAAAPPPAAPPPAAPAAPALLRIEDLGVCFPVRGTGQSVQALRHVSFGLPRGQTLAVVGESGCGKTTLLRAITGLIQPDEGAVFFDHERLTGKSTRGWLPYRRRIQMVFQKPLDSLNRRRTVGEIVAMPLVVHRIGNRAERAARVAATLEAVGLSTTLVNRYPHELSGGQQRRVGLARILVLRPRIVILDEPTSGLDLSVQATVLGVIDELRRRFGLTYLFVSHDLSVVERMCEDVAILYLGRIVEIGPTAEIFARPQHPYTRALLAAAPRLEPGSLNDTPALPGDPPSPTNLVSGCTFRPRCAFATPKCAEARPPLRPIGTRHSAACVRLEEIGASAPA
jgi:oligopeptide/dipeptide ABC transporter ATP-binding protein